MYSRRSDVCCDHWGRANGLELNGVRHLIDFNVPSNGANLFPFCKNLYLLLADEV